MASPTDFNTMRMRYEVLGESLEDLSTEYGFGTKALQAFAEEEGWCQKPLPSVIDQVEPKDLETYAKNLLETTQHKLSVLSIYNQLYLRPRYIELEHQLLEKALEMTKQLDPSAPGASASLKRLVSSLNDLTQRSGLLQGGAAQGDEMLKDNGLTVNLIQQFVDKTSPTENEIKIN